MLCAYYSTAYSGTQMNTVTTSRNHNIIYTRHTRIHHHTTQMALLSGWRCDDDGCCLLFRNCAHSNTEVSKILIVRSMRLYGIEDKSIKTNKIYSTEWTESTNYLDFRILQIKFTASYYDVTR